MRALLLAICLSLSLAFADTVCSVHDGDTLTTCQGRKVRLFGVDAPELKQPFGRDARDFVIRLTQNREVRLDCVGKSFKRSVCRSAVYTGSGWLDLSTELVGWGYGFDSPKHSKGRYSGAEAFAQKMKRGVWVDPAGGIRPWDWRKH